MWHTRCSPGNEDATKRSTTRDLAGTLLADMRREEAALLAADLDALAIDARGG